MLRYAGYLISLFLLGSCLDTQVALSGDDYKLIDSLYNEQKSILLPVLNEECDQYRDSVLQLWIDSIMAERLEEIEKLTGGR